MKAKLWFDGSAAPTNPGPSTGAYVLQCEDGRTLSGAMYIGENTNNVAEFCGLIIGLQRARELKVKHLEVFGDSKLVIQIASGKWKGKMPHIKQLGVEARNLVEKFEKVEISWIRRKENAFADMVSKVFN